MLRDKKIVIGVTGSIAAYKTAILIRLLIKEGAMVKVIMTPSAREFITPLTLSTLSKNPVLSDFFQKDSGVWQSHVDLGLWADAVLVAPASANTIAKFAHGICDNLLTAVYLSARCPIYIAPAMDIDMYKHPATRNNLELLKQNGNTIIDTEYGELASGLTGEGRMAEPEHIIDYFKKKVESSQTLAGKTALVTAGPTYEAIDPVRFIGNHSSGKMGFALAENLAQRGARVILVSGPTHLKTLHKNIELFLVGSADEMFNRCDAFFKDCEITILAAAVADYKPIKVSGEKIKKISERLTVELKQTVDIAKRLGQLKQKHQIMIGFALETEEEDANARKKLESKNFDFIVLNSLRDQGAGFGVDTNKISIIDRRGKKDQYALKNKSEVAADIIDRIIEILNG